MALAVGVGLTLEPGREVAAVGVGLVVADALGWLVPDGLTDALGAGSLAAGSLGCGTSGPGPERNGPASAGHSG